MPFAAPFAASAASASSWASSWRPLGAGATLRGAVALAVRGRPPATVVAEAGADEHDEVARLHAASFDPAWSEDEIDRLARRPGTVVLLARAEGGGAEPALGFLLLRQAGAEAEILSVGVDPALRRRGAGDALVRAAIRRCQHDRLEELFLEVDAANRAAVALYRRLGFRQVGERKGYYPRDDAPPARALVMRLALA